MANESVFSFLKNDSQQSIGMDIVDKTYAFLCDANLGNIEAEVAFLQQNKNKNSIFPQKLDLWIKLCSAIEDLHKLYHFNGR